MSLCLRLLSPFQTINTLYYKGASCHHCSIQYDAMSWCPCSDLLQTLLFFVHIYFLVPLCDCSMSIGLELSKAVLPDIQGTFWPIYQDVFKGGHNLEKEKFSPQTWPLSEDLNNGIYIYTTGILYLLTLWTLSGGPLGPTWDAIEPTRGILSPSNKP